MPTTVYFDTNVFRHLREEEEGVIRRAIDTNRISILLSVINLEELLAALESAPESEVLCRTRRLLTLVDRGRFLKDASMLLTDDLRSYARCGFAERPFLSDDDYIRALQGLRALQAGDPSLNVQEINMEARMQRVQFLRSPV